ncbi:hypothetical protein [Campylobacter sp. MIT 97-5078]|uniref:hypothetical protein n=1 Tax=Campylobacter sp. MIT 97-5078 TaxID=1548153 RepID=UPI000513A02E|nr:hypothetical protein [Campylobacter sp. MIT 97-5078]KGI55213.1 hypothetical protein LR59_12980 [Campylobacter sp. MIT 97-5078]TQR27428.1 hypothetical protein DMB91_04010 [Campylobacter sp. MIT 97-5078]
MFDFILMNDFTLLVIAVMSVVLVSTILCAVLAAAIQSEIESYLKQRRYKKCLFLRESSISLRVGDFKANHIARLIFSLTDNVNREYLLYFLIGVSSIRKNIAMLLRHNIRDCQTFSLFRLLH